MSQKLSFNLTEMVMKKYNMNIGGIGIMRLTNNPGLDSVPRWMPDVKRIVYFSSNEAKKIFTMNTDGSEKRTLLEIF